ncbi:MAG: TIGR00730 family Rossman fold protein [Clostridia bacterium]|nr:TIGR00730 family Rossman fold protein [Clostridia bacterium]
MNICVYGASSNNIDPKYIKDTEELGVKMGEHGHSLIYGAGANGLMGAAARGVTKGGGKVIGVVPSFFNVDGILYDKCEELIYTETMRERKQIMEDRSDAFVMVPGGVGTFDEFFEILTLKQLARHAKPIAILNISGYYDKLFQFLEHASDEGFLRETYVKMFKIFDNSDALLDYIENYDGELMLYKDLK